MKGTDKGVAVMIMAIVLQGENRPVTVRSVSEAINQYWNIYVSDYHVRKAFRTMIDAQIMRKVVRGKYIVCSESYFVSSLMRATGNDNQMKFEDF